MSEFSIVHWLIFGAIAWAVFKLFKRSPAPVMYCRQCGALGTGTRTTRGSLVMEIVLWLMFLVPGFIYSVWRLSTRHTTCGVCGSKDVIPPESPVARQAIKAAAEARQ